MTKYSKFLEFNTILYEYVFHNDTDLIEKYFDTTLPLTEEDQKNLKMICDSFDIDIGKSMQSESFTNPHKTPIFHISFTTTNMKKMDLMVYELKYLIYYYIIHHIVLINRELSVGNMQKIKDHIYSLMITEDGKKLIKLAIEIYTTLEYIIGHNSYLIIDHQGPAFYQDISDHVLLI